MSVDETPKVDVVPFLKWAGGKRWFAEHHLELLPRDYNRYVEPFLGGGAVFFEIGPDQALLSDINADLIRTYGVVREKPEELKTLLALHHIKHCKEYYYLIRSKKPIDDVELAAWFLYLNRTCWNGLYRVNMKNEFNVPIGTKTAVTLQSDNFAELSSMLKDTVIRCVDFEETINESRKGDFVFVDPPYTVKHNLNGFVKYNDRIFSWQDQIRLRDAVVRASKRGAMILVTNANHQSIRDLYHEVGSFTALRRASVLAAASRFRANVEELVVRTWA